MDARIFSYGSGNRVVALSDYPSPHRAESSLSDYGRRVLVWGSPCAVVVPVEELGAAIEEVGRAVEADGTEDELNIKPGGILLEVLPLAGGEVDTDVVNDTVTGVEIKGVDGDRFVF